MGGGGPPPPQPVPAGQVAQTQQGLNTAAAQASQRGSMVNQNNPFGSLGYQQIGVGPDGTPIYGSSISLSPQQQQLYNILTGTQTAAGLGGSNLISSAGYGNVSPAMAIGTGTSGISGDLMKGYTSLMQPFFTQQTQQLDTQLRNQGLFPSPSADPANPQTWGPYERAMYQNQTTQAQQVAGAAAQFQPQAFQEATSLYTMPATLGMQLAGFGQYQLPTGALVQTPGLGITPADYTGAVSQMENIQQQNYQAQIAQQDALMSGLFGLGGKIGAAAILSDRRLKEDIEQIGQLPNGLPIYNFRFKGSNEHQVGLMADDVLKVKPWAVYTNEDMYLMVDYDEAVK
jgi:Chaperone of endosialidase